MRTSQGQDGLVVTNAVAVNTPGDLVVWWRDESNSTDVPRSHSIGWSTSNAASHGHIIIASEHLRLSRNQVETQLRAELGDHDFCPAHECWTDLEPAARIVANGHSLHTTDLRHHYGPDADAGVAAELRGRGIAARIVLDHHLTPDEQREHLTWAEQQLNVFRALDPAGLTAHGWSCATSSRWQIIHHNRATADGAAK